MIRWGVCNRAKFAAQLPVGAVEDHCDYGNIKTQVVQNPNPGMAGLPASITVPVGDTGVSVVMTAPTGIPPAYVAPEGIFRTECFFAKMAALDPIVYPGQSLAGHLHAFFGNTGINGSSTPQSLATSGNSTCLGGTLNRTAYWFPAVFDAVTGEVQTPYQGQFYYKNGILDPTTIQPIPAGLRMIAGNKASTGPQFNVQWQCQKVWNNQSAIDGMIPNCAVGDLVMLIIYFPECWDGVNLDSPDHQSHMAFAIYRNSPGQVSSCPSTHPVPLPRITEIVRYIVSASSNPVNWRLSSDMYSGSIRGGLSAHADWMDGWNRDAMNSIVRNCINAQRDCGVGSLGDGRDLVYRSP